MGFCACSALASLDQVGHPALFIAFPLVTISPVDANYLPKQLALGAVLFLGQGFYRLDHGRRDRET